MRCALSISKKFIQKSFAIIKTQKIFNFYIYLRFLLRIQITQMAVAKAPTKTTHPKTTTPISKDERSTLLLLCWCLSLRPLTTARTLGPSNLFSISRCFDCSTLKIFHYDIIFKIKLILTHFSKRSMSTTVFSRGSTAYKYMSVLEYEESN